LGFRCESEFSKSLRVLYDDEKLSHGLIAERIGIHVETVRLLCRRYGIKARDHDESTSIRHQRRAGQLAMTDEEHGVLDGLLLGDGSLTTGPGKWSARYSHGSKHLETLRSIALALPSMHFAEPHVHESVRCGTDLRGFFFKSWSYAALLPEWERWYGREKKHVPSDLHLTPQAMYWWFVGDGSIQRTRYDIKMSTEGFSESCRDILQAELERLTIHTTRPSSGTMTVCSESAMRFFGLIGPCKNPEYEYKWNYRPPRWHNPRRSGAPCHAH